MVSACVGFTVEAEITKPAEPPSFIVDGGNTVTLTVGGFTFIFPVFGIAVAAETLFSAVSLITTDL
jgi:hypothetical protein